jgi:hypothetical protein
MIAMKRPATLAATLLLGCGGGSPTDPAAPAQPEPIKAGQYDLVAINGTRFGPDGTLIHRSQRTNGDSVRAVFRQSWVNIVAPPAAGLAARFTLTLHGEARIVGDNNATYYPPIYTGDWVQQGDSLVMQTNFMIVLRGVRSGDSLHIAMDAERVDGVKERVTFVRRGP